MDLEEELRGVVNRFEVSTKQHTANYNSKLFPH